MHPPPQLLLDGLKLGPEINLKESSRCRFAADAAADKRRLNLRLRWKSYSGVELRAIKSKKSARANPVTLVTRSTALRPTTSR
jgi:hypothetical protein